MLVETSFLQRRKKASFESVYFCERAKTPMCQTSSTDDVLQCSSSFQASPHLPPTIHPKSTTCACTCKRLITSNPVFGNLNILYDLKPWQTDRQKHFFWTIWVQKRECARSHSAATATFISEEAAVCCDFLSSTLWSSSFQERALFKCLHCFVSFSLLPFWNACHWTLKYYERQTPTINNN